MTRPFVPLIFAGDINVYSVSRAFHEEYGIVPTAYGKYPTGICMDSRIIDYHADEGADENDTFMRIVEEFAAKHSNETVLLIGCGDSYVQLMSANRDNFPDNVTAPYIDINLMNDLIHKEKFYALCEKNGVDYPTTWVHRPDMGLDVEAPFDGPYIIKPSNGIEYWRHPYETQKKVYKEETWQDVLRVLGDIYGSGYDDSVVIQDYIPGNDTCMRVLTNYSDRNGKVKMMCLGHVLLEEHTPHGLGNHAVIIREKNEELLGTFRKLLEDIGYTGFSNFDIRYDSRDGKFKALEINTRQGRSNWYVTADGCNIAKLLVDDRIKNEPLEYRTVDSGQMFTVVPKKVAFTYIKEEEYREQMRRLISSGKVSNPIVYSRDNGLMHRLRVFRNMHRHYAAFEKYYK